jgi:hypothetical protein
MKSDGFGHSMQAKGVKFVEGSDDRARSVLLIVIARTTDVGVQDRRAVIGALLRGTPIEAVVED